MRPKIIAKNWHIMLECCQDAVPVLFFYVCCPVLYTTASGRGHIYSMPN